MKNLIKSRSALTLLSILFVIAASATVFLAASNKKLSASDQDTKILFAEDSHDFGKVEAGPVLEYSFKFTNEGDKPLVIERVQPSCGCTGAATDGKNEYAEGESGEIKITFNTQGRVGHQEKHITVMTNDTQNPKKDLKFTCDLEDGTNNDAK